MGDYLLYVYMEEREMKKEKKTSFISQLAVAGEDMVRALLLAEVSALH